MRLLRTKVVMLGAVGLVIALVVGGYGDSPSPVLAQEPTIRVRPVQRIPEDAPRFVAGEVLARFRGDLPESAIEALLKAGGARTLSVSHLTGYRRVAVPPGMPEEALLKHLPAAPMRLMVLMTPNTGCSGTTLRQRGASTWCHPGGTFTGVNQVSGYNGSGVIVAVIDTGLAYKAFPSHPSGAGVEGPAVEGGAASRCGPGPRQPGQ